MQYSSEAPTVVVDAKEEPNIEDDENPLSCSPQEVALRQAKEDRLPTLLSEDSPIFDPSKRAGGRVPLSVCKGLTFVETPTESSEESADEGALEPSGVAGRTNIAYAF
ncbi:hypothetical protein Pmar_PMAR020383 [Perkinsus marinus ATCC 50983]|uniref:Uncharacterized protein n=1 Tax=Perkinsus marinus (strain ATCC 50983 / TXsc) TaxID=423536 RepID=C5L6W2_PERM5|nr:hypothetical protein Pmar_PMAR020383 [Perkinsus marinus ATCC 50983]EER07224.1 hypothetical protein Pmar_PMAR020383 [Perkinsus marinus ATCC 50983]|eukprot:XP_002775408.1 hypothetical protein Pmar_PMAR020383 [Perkinsus marinus ATCC 50983]